MTAFIPLNANASPPQLPSFLNASQDSENRLGNVLKAIMKAKRIVVVCGMARPASLASRGGLKL